MKMQKINKTKALKLFLQGGKIFVVPCKANISNIWVNPFEVKTENLTKEDFEKFCNSVIYYNCNYEMGYYLNYYYMEE